MIPTTIAGAVATAVLQAGVLPGPLGELASQYGRTVVIGGAVAVLGAIVVVGRFVTQRASRTVRRGANSARDRVAERRSEDIDLADVDDGRFDQAVDILEANGEETTRSNIRKQIRALNQLEEMDEDDVNIGILQNDEEKEVADKRIIAPNIIDESADHIMRNGKYARIFTLSGFPEKVAVGWLTGLFTTNGNVRVSYQIEPRDTSSVLGKLQSQLTRVRVSLAKKYEKNRTDTHKQERDKSVINDLIEGIIQGSTKLFDYAIYIEVTADSKEELDATSRDVIQMFAERSAELIPVVKRQTEMMEAMAPVASDPLKNTQLMQEMSVGTSFPFVEPAITDPNGAMLGFDDTGMPIMLDPFAMNGYDVAISGMKGSGKTVFSLLMDYRDRLNNPELESIFLDPLGDNYIHYVESLGGQVIKFGGDNVINPLEIREANDHVEDPYKDKMRSLMGMIRAQFDAKNQNLSSTSDGIMQRVFHLTYLSCGISPNPETHHRDAPPMQATLDIIKEIANGNDPGEYVQPPEDIDDYDEIDERIEMVSTRLRKVDEGAAHDLLLGLEDFNKDGVNGNLNGETNIELDNDIVVFDMSMFADTKQAPLMLHVMLEWLYQRSQDSNRRTRVTIDEAHYLLKREEPKDLLNLFSRHGRHFNTGLTLISQTVDEFVKDEKSKEIYDQINIKAVFHLEHLAEESEEYLRLSPNEKEYIMSAATGQDSNYSECLLSVSGYGRRRVEVRLGDYEKHVLFDDLSPWDYLVEHDDLSPADIQYLDEQDMLSEYRHQISDDVLTRAGV